MPDTSIPTEAKLLEHHMTVVGNMNALVSKYAGEAEHHQKAASVLFNDKIELERNMAGYKEELSKLSLQKDELQRAVDDYAYKLGITHIVYIFSAFIVGALVIAFQTHMI